MNHIHLLDMKNSKKLLLIMTLFLLPLCAMYCNKSKVNKISKETPGYYKISISEGGGITGVFSGYNLFSNGIVEHWRRDPGKEISIKWSKTLKVDKIQVFKSRLQEDEILNSKLNETGNMTTYISLELTDSTTQWSWSGAGAFGNSSVSVKQLYKDILNYCNSLN